MLNAIDGTSFQAKIQIKNKTKRVTNAICKERKNTTQSQLLKRFEKYADVFEKETADFPNSVVQIKCSQVTNSSVKRGDLFFVLETDGQHIVEYDHIYLYDTRMPKENFIKQMLKDFKGMLDVQKYYDDVKNGKYNLQKL